MYVICKGIAIKIYIPNKEELMTALGAFGSISVIIVMSGFLQFELAINNVYLEIDQC